MHEKNLLRTEFCVGKFSKTYPKKIVFWWLSHKPLGLPSPVFPHKRTALAAMGLVFDGWRVCLQPLPASPSPLINFLIRCSSDSNEVSSLQPPAPPHPQQN